MNFEIKINEKLSLILRSENTAEEFFKLIDKNRQELRRWLPWVDSTVSVEDTKKYTLECREKFKNKESVSTSILYEGSVVGSVGFNKVDLINEWAEIGYWLDKDHQGKGIMTECVKAIIEYGFNDLGLNRIIIKCDSLNTKSKAIPERLGFKIEATLREDHKYEGNFSDGLIYGLLKTEWHK